MAAAAARPGGRRGACGWSQVSGLGQVRSSSRVPGSKNIRVFSSKRMKTLRPPRISAAATYRLARWTAPPLLTIRSTSIAAPQAADQQGGEGAITVR